jgi:hypothetical protein
MSGLVFLGLRHHSASRKLLVGLVAHDGAASFAGHEAANQADLDRRSVHVAPGQPEAVRVAELALAVVLLHLFGREDVLAAGDRVLRVAVGLIEGVHFERPGDLHRLFLVGPIKPNAAAKAADRRRAVLMQHGVLPDGDQLHGPSELAVLA